MGMFDYVEVDKAHGLPDVEYQSKDFDCEMTTIRITENGHLEIERCDYESVPKAERPYPNEDGFLGMMGSMRKINCHWDDLRFHGIFNFYGQSGPNISEDWLEYSAKFSDGKLVEIVRDNT